MTEKKHERYNGPVSRCVGSGNYMLDTIVVREYPDGPAAKKFTEKDVLKEVGGTCGNVMCILAHLGLEAYPQASLDNSPEGLKMTADLKRYGCDTRFVTNTSDGGTTLLRVTHKLNPDGTPNTAHSLNPVPFIYIPADCKEKDGKFPYQCENGILADVAPSICHILGIEQPAEMTGHCLIKEI